MTQRISFLLLLLPFCLRAQSIQPVLLSPAGDAFTSGSAMLTFSAGEPCTASHLVSAAWLTEGFQQPRLIVEEVPGAAGNMATVEVSIWPNPFSDQLYLSVTGAKGAVNASITTMSGAVVYQNPFTACPAGCFIPTTHLPAGTYLLLLTDADGNRLACRKVIRY